MLKRVEIMVVDKYTGEVKHDIKKTCQLDVKQDFDDWIHKFADGFCRLIRQSSDNVINISCEDYQNPQDQFLFDVY